jgi:hypothetical protein
MNTRPSELDNKTDPIGNKTDEASAAVGGIQVSAPLDATAAETTKFCTKQCTISSTFIVVIVYVLAIVSNFLVSVASGRFAGSVIGFLVGGLIPGIVVMIWFSEHMGGTSVDRCQIATVWFTMLGVLVLWSLGFVYLWQLLLAQIYTVDGKILLANPRPMPRGDLCCQWFNQTLHPPGNATDDPYRQDFCFCPATGMFYGLAGSIPEELLK